MSDPKRRFKGLQVRLNVNNNISDSIDNSVVIDLLLGCCWSGHHGYIDN